VTRGIGLGLALVKKWVGLHAGTVKVHSEGADLGTEFVVCLPLMQESAAHPSGFMVSMASTE
jgi:signal transduction histidine kinase